MCALFTHYENILYIYLFRMWSLNFFLGHLILYRRLANKFMVPITSESNPQVIILSDYLVFQLKFLPWQVTDQNYL